MRADNAIATTIEIDLHRRDADRRWVEVEVDVPATETGAHGLTLETRTVGSSNSGWALFRDPVFQAGTVRTGVERPTFKSA